jgi:hypothetical protein
MIHFVIRPRQEGKTTYLVEWAKLNGGLVLTFNETEARRLRHVHGIDAECFEGQPLRGRPPRPVAVDNVDIVLERLLGAPIDLASATGLLLP